MNYALTTPSGQQAAPQLPSPHTEQEAPQQSLLSSPKDKEASQQPLLSSPTPKDKEAPQLPSPPTETKAPKDKEASPVQVMPLPPSRMINPPLSSPYDTIHEDLALYKTMTHSDPIDQFFAAIKNLKSPPGTSSAMSRPAQHVETYTRVCEIESYKEYGEVYNQDKLLVRPHNPIFMKEHLHEGTFFTSTQFSKRPFPLRRLYNWYITASSLGVMNITFEILRNAFYSGVRIRSIDFKDLWLMFHQKCHDMNLLVVFCL
jgi:hypothetical protein